jgi:prepilin-type N-terminal cleavage/methylation domain-containing protein
MRTQTAKRGFTMIELLVVVLILAIIITVVIHVSQTVIARGKAETTRKDMQLVLLGIDAFAETDANKNPPIERGTPGAPAPYNLFPGIDPGGTRDPRPDFAASDPDGNNNWMAFLRAKYLSQQLLGWTDSTTTPADVHIGNAAAKAKLGNVPAVGFTYSYTDPFPTPKVFVNYSQPLFVDAYGKYMDYSSSRGVGSTPVLISAGPDGKFGNEDDIRSDRR